MEIKQWKEWLKGCSDVSETEGSPKTKKGKEVKPYVMSLGRDMPTKRAGEDLMSWRARCWKQYKKDNNIKS